MLELTSGGSVLTLLPELGGAVASWRRDGVEVLHPVSDPNLIAQHERPVAAYPLIPFSNRVGYGRFGFGGERFQLAANFGGEPHTIHGNGWMRAWRVAEAQAARAVLTLDHQGPPEQWPYHYQAAITYLLAEDSLSVSIRYENTDERAQPVGLGFHPFFPRTDDTTLLFQARDAWVAGRDALPDRCVPAVESFCFSPTRPVTGTNLDNCFNGWNGEAVLHWPGRRLALSVSASPLFGHLVVYTPPGRDYLAVEPTSNMSNGVNWLDKSVETGLRVLQPGESLEGEVVLALFRP